MPAYSVSLRMSFWTDETRLELFTKSHQLCENVIKKKKKEHYLLYSTEQTQLYGLLLRLVSGRLESMCENTHEYQGIMEQNIQPSAQLHF